MSYRLEIIRMSVASFAEVASQLRSSIYCTPSFHTPFYSRHHALRDSVCLLTDDADFVGHGYILPMLGRYTYGTVADIACACSLPRKMPSTVAGPKEGAGIKRSGQKLRHVGDGYTPHFDMQLSL